MRSLPAPLGEIEIPEAFTVTAVAAHQGCDLKMLVAAKKFDPIKLSAGPDAAIGILVHSALDAAERSDLPAADLFECCVALMHAELSGDAERAHFADLSLARSNMEWRNLRATTIAKIVSLREARATNRLTSQDSQEPRKSGSEVTLASSSLRLMGRSDRIRRGGGGSLTITDFKTGQIFGTDGAILESIQRQLFLYALLAEEGAPGAAIQLAVESPVGRFDLEWNVDSRARAHAIITQITARLPAGAIVRAAETARPGEECRRCSLRPACAAYLNAAPLWWKELPFDLTAPPTDTWGTLVLMNTTDNRSTIEILDDADRRVKITGLRFQPGFERLSPSDRIYAFSLEATGGGKGWDGTRFHPHTFHEIPPDRHSKRAWSATLFSQGESRPLPHVGIRDPI
jgi:hypothetical protein